jgi:adenosylcobinamide-GDP ribazoletransferase
MPPLPPRWDDAARWWDEFRLAAAFLTRLPLGPRTLGDDTPLAQAGWAFPLVGVVVGLLGGLAYAVAAWLNIPVLPSALIAVGATILVTGGIHEDGLADTADGFAGGADREEKLAIMRDSRIGSFGVLALIFSIGLRSAALAAIGDGGRVAAALAASHAVGRGFLPLVLRALEPAREDGLGVKAGRPEPTVAWLSAGFVVLIALIALDFTPGLVAVAAAAVVMVLRAGVAQRQIGGYTGDVLGALEQGGEVVVLLVAAAWAT